MRDAVVRLLRPFTKSFVRRDDGSATVEAVLWMPIFMAIFALMLDSSMMYHGQSKVLRIVQDANRVVSVSSFKDSATAETYAETFIKEKLATFDVTAKTINTMADDNVVLTTVTVPAREFQVFGMFSALLNLEIDVSAGHLRDTVDFASLASSGVTVSY